MDIEVILLLLVAGVVLMPLVTIVARRMKRAPKPPSRVDQIEWFTEQRHKRDGV